MGDDLMRDTPSLNLLIIRAVKMNPILWDDRVTKSSPLGASKIVWSKMAGELNIDVPFLKTRWRSLRDRFFKMKRENPMTQSSPWPFYEHIKFIEPYRKPARVKHLTRLMENRADSDSKRRRTFPISPMATQPMRLPQRAVETPEDSFSEDEDEVEIIDSDIEIKEEIVLPQVKEENQREEEQPLPVQSESVIKSSAAKEIVNQPEAPSSTSASAVIENNTQRPHSFNRIFDDPRELTDYYFYLNVAMDAEHLSFSKRLKLRNAVTVALMAVIDES